MARDAPQPPPTSFDGRARIFAALTLGLVVLFAILQQTFVRDLRLATQFADVPRFLPLPVAVLFPIASVVIQVVAHTQIARWLERRHAGVLRTALISLLVGSVICTALVFAAAAAAHTLGGGPLRLVVRGIVGGTEVYALWVLALKYPRLIDDVRLRAIEAEQARKDAEIAQLREHLQPHFLRNTLNAISALVSEDPAEARNLLAALADLLSDSIEDSAPERTLGAEIAWLRRYAEILEVRFRGSLRFTWDEEAAASRTLVPRLLLQPLLENAIHHGALARDCDGAVTVRTRRIPAGGTRVEIFDNGPGFDPARASDCVGLTLVRRRVAAESRGSFHLESGSGGTLAVVELP